MIQLSEILLYKQQASNNVAFNTTTVNGSGKLINSSSNFSLNSNNHFKSKSFQTLPNGFITCQLTLLKRINVTENGWTILRILGQRSNTEPMAREFMNLKSACRNDP